MRLRLIILISFLSLAVGNAAGQGMKHIRINEVLVNNTDSYMDQYGHRSSWIELHNTSHTSTNIAGGFLRVIREKGDTISYKIPKNDPATIIPTLGYAVFYADGTGSKGTFYTNFKLEGKGVLQLYDQSGKGASLSQVEYDSEKMTENVSCGWFTRNHTIGEVWVDALPETTPNSTNDTIEFKARADLFHEKDSTGFIMAITAMGVVFCSLLLLFLTFKLLSQIMRKVTAFRERKDKEARTAVSVAKGEVKGEGIPGETIAAIGMALKLYEEDLHDLESTVITINRVARSYSPWSSKIYGIMNQPK